MLAGTSMTVSFWFKINPADLCGSPYAVLINAYARGFYFWNYDCTTASNTWCYNQNMTTLCTDADHTRSINRLATNTWQHLVLVQQLTGPWVLYVNGVSRATYNWVVALSGASSYWLPNAGVAAFNVKGTYDDLFVVKAVVTAAQAQLGGSTSFPEAPQRAQCAPRARTARAPPLWSSARPPPTATPRGRRFAPSASLAPTSPAATRPRASRASPGRPVRLV